MEQTANRCGAPKSAPKNDKGLFATWYRLQLDSGLTQADALRRLNECCGTKYKANWISLQQNSVQEKTRTPILVRRYMMEAVLREKLAQLGVASDGVVRDFLNDLI